MQFYDVLMEFDKKIIGFKFKILCVFSGCDAERVRFDDDYKEEIN